MNRNWNLFIFLWASFITGIIVGLVIFSGGK